MSLGLEYGQYNWRYGQSMNRIISIIIREFEKYTKQNTEKLT